MIAFNCNVVENEIADNMYQRFELDWLIGNAWMTFANNPYQTIRRPLQFIVIDTTNNASAPSFNSYNRTLFTSRYDEATRAKAKNDFRTKLVEAFDAAELPELGDNRKFGVDTKKVVFEAILSVYEGAIALENRGSGMESLIKTEIALEKANGLDVILMEEPENHLSFTTLRKMLHEISIKQKDSQIIVATHNNMIASHLNLNNVLWITENEVKSLSGVDKAVAEFFVKADDNAFLQLLLSNKVFLVEGATEFLLLPYFYKQITGKTIEEDGISVISCNGISYKNYLEIAKKTNKKISVITDNDGKQNRIDEAITFNITSAGDHIGQVIWADDIADEVLSNDLITKLVYSEAARYSFSALNWSYAKGDTVDCACIILTKDFEKLAEDKFSTKKISISTLNKLYVAMTRSRGDLYLIKASTFKKLQNAYIKSRYT